MKRDYYLYSQVNGKVNIGQQFYAHFGEYYIQFTLNIKRNTEKIVINQIKNKHAKIFLLKLQYISKLTFLSILYVYTLYRFLMHCPIFW